MKKFNMLSNEKSENSLQDKSWKRAIDLQPPNVATPYEWEEFFQLMKDNEVIGVFRSEVALEDAMKRLEAESRPAPVKKPKTKKKAKKKKEK